MFNLFNGKKKDKKEGYFLELNEAEASTPVIEEEKPPVVAKSKEKKGTSKKGDLKKAEPVEQVQQEPKYETVSIAEVVSRSKPEPVEEGNHVNFATDYILTQTLSRRVPGPSLDKFKNIARQIKK